MCAGADMRELTSVSDIPAGLFLFNQYSRSPARKVEGGSKLA